MDFDLIVTHLCGAAIDGMGLLTRVQQRGIRVPRECRNTIGTALEAETAAQWPRS
jgi:ribosome-binding protein aMBF1 (putative translation factor)